MIAAPAVPASAPPGQRARGGAVTISTLRLLAAVFIAASPASHRPLVNSTFGFSVMQANGPGAGQSVGHFHLHIIPRRDGDGLLFNWDPKPGERDRIAAVAERIRAAL